MVGINYFYAIHPEASDYGDFMQSFDRLKSEGAYIPINLVAIADDVGGNAICISVKGKDKGKVYFWDHESAAEEELEDPKSYKDVELIADSFDEFMAGLREDDEPHDEVL